MIGGIAGFGSALFLLLRTVPARFFYLSPDLLLFDPFLTARARGPGGMPLLFRYQGGRHKLKKTFCHLLPVPVLGTVLF